MPSLASMPGIASAGLQGKSRSSGLGASGPGRPGRLGGMEDDPTFVECWRWRYRDPETGRICQTLCQLSEREAAELREAQRIEGSMSLREVDADDFPDTGPEVHRVTCESQQSP